MSFTNFAFRGTGDDWDAQTLSEEDQTTEDLASLGMHSTDEETKDEDAESDAPTATIIVEEDVIVDGLADLDRLERELHDDELGLEETDEDE